MSTLMHFRKRILLEYESATSVSDVTESEEEYFSSTSPLNSDRTISPENAENSENSDSDEHFPRNFKTTTSNTRIDSPLPSPARKKLSQTQMKLRCRKLISQLQNSQNQDALYRLPSFADTFHRELWISKPNLFKKNSKSVKFEKLTLTLAKDKCTIIIGPNGTEIPQVAWAIIDWNRSVAAITRKILTIVFDRDTLAHYSLTGKPSTSDTSSEQIKGRLDPSKIEDIIYLITGRTHATKCEVRTAIAKKCCDDSKANRWKIMKKICGSKDNKRV